MYEEYLKAHSGYLIRRIWLMTGIWNWRKIAAAGKFDAGRRSGVMRAGKPDWAEGAAAPFHLMQQYFLEKTGRALFVDDF